MNQIVIRDAQQQWLKFSNPTCIVKTFDIAEVLPKLQLVNELVQNNRSYAVGFISYEAASAFDPVLTTHQSNPAFPLLWFGLYQNPQKISLAQPSASQNFELNWLSTVTQTEYNKAIAKIKDYISRGDTYQVNYTMRLRAEFEQDPWQYFLHLNQAQQAKYSAYIDLEDWAICSASPELFFTWDGNQIVTRPMKGTSARGYTLKSDRNLAQQLQNSAKNRAENVMIVDMIRNDLARVAQLNTVKVPSLFDVERYPTLWQMTSTVTAQTTADLPAIMTALFPCASITGAPKPRTMEIIRQLETTPRNIYTGTIGMISPDSQAQFNVAIRTVLIDKQAHRAEYGVGGGIVWDSASASEYEECQIKAQILLNTRPEFELLETILWTPQKGYFLLEDHLSRLQDSASYFGFWLDLPQIQSKLATVANNLDNKSYKVRLLVDKTGKITIESKPFTPPAANKIVNLAIAKEPINIHNPFLYHKTTNRQIYRQFAAQYSHCDDVLLWNERQEITESCIANVVLKIDGEMLTPPVKSGLLAGTFRAALLQQNKITEQTVKLSDLDRCEAIYLINSVRQWQQAKIIS